MSLGKKFVVGVAGAFAVVFILDSLGGSKDNQTGGSSNNSSAVRAASTAEPAPAASTRAQLAARNMPGDEAAFATIVKRAADAYRAAGSNELQAGAARPVRAKALCEALRSTHRNWTGTVRTLSTNGDGKGVLLIKLSDGITVGTWNNSFSDIGDGTLIDPSSPVYRAALSLKVGAAVSFSYRPECRPTWSRSVVRDFATLASAGSQLRSGRRLDQAAAPCVRVAPKS